MTDYAKPTRCFGCGSTEINTQFGWVRSSNKHGDPVFWLCDICRDRRPHLEWSVDGRPRVMTFEREAVPA